MPSCRLSVFRSRLGTGTGSVPIISGHQLQRNERNRQRNLFGQLSQRYAGDADRKRHGSIDVRRLGRRLHHFGHGYNLRLDGHVRAQRHREFPSAAGVQQLTFNPGTNVVQQAAFDCPSNPNPTPGNPCTDPNAHSFQLQIAQVNSTVNVTVTATEVPPSQADGLCEVGDTVLNDFDCRFAVLQLRPRRKWQHHRAAVLPVRERQLRSLSGLFWYAGNGTRSQHVYWSDQLEDYLEQRKLRPTGALYRQHAAALRRSGRTPSPGAVGCCCGQLMTIDGVAQTYSCQFEFDITTFFNSTQPVDAVIGGTTKQLTDVVVAFPPANSGQLNATSTPDAASVAAGTPIGLTIAVSNTGSGLLAALL